jgi:hypothetical protein
MARLAFVTPKRFEPFTAQRNRRMCGNREKRLAAGETAFL